LNEFPANGDFLFLWHDGLWTSLITPQCIYQYASSIYPVYRYHAAVFCCFLIVSPFIKEKVYLADSQFEKDKGNSKLLIVVKWINTVMNW